MLRSPRLSTAGRAARSADRSGFSLVELMIALIVLTVCGYFLSATVSATAAQNVSRREATIAANAVWNILEDMRDVSFRELFASYNANADDDPLGAGTAPGPNFAVDGLAVRPDDPDGFAGQIILSATSAPLREDVTDAQLGLPRDLNGDARIDAEDHSADYILLPATVRIEWEGRMGPRSFEITTMFADLSKP